MKQEKKCNICNKNFIDDNSTNQCSNDCKKQEQRNINKQDKSKMKVRKNAS